MDGRMDFFPPYDPLFKMVARDRIYGNVICSFTIIELFAGKRLLSTSGTRAYVITEDIYRVICLPALPPRSSSRMAITPIHSHARAHTRPTMRYVSRIVSIAKGHTTFHFRATKLFYARIRYKLLRPLVSSTRVSHTLIFRL